MDLINPQTVRANLADQSAPAMELTARSPALLNPGMKKVLDELKGYKRSVVTLSDNPLRYMRKLLD